MHILRIFRTLDQPGGLLGLTTTLLLAAFCLPAAVLGAAVLSAAVLSAAVLPAAGSPGSAQVQDPKDARLHSGAAGIDLSAAAHFDLASAPSAGQGPTRDTAAPNKADDCADGFSYDDGTPDNAIGWVNRETSRFVMRFDDVGQGTAIEEVCVCLTRATSDGDPNLAFELVIHADDSADGQPGTELAVVPVSATGLPVGFTPNFYSYSVADQSIVSTTPHLWIGIDMPRDTSFEELRALCTDLNEDFRRPVYTSNDDGESWTDLGTLPTFGDPDALMVRATFTQTERMYLPYYEVDTFAADARSTLLLVRNTTDEATTVRYDYLSQTGELLRREEEMLAAEATRSVNLRDVPGLPTTAGFRLGWMRVERLPFEAVEPFATPSAPLLTGDFFQVDPGNDFATGSRLPNEADLCLLSEARFLDFGSGTELRVFLRRPLGADTVLDPPSFSIRLLDEAGIELDTRSFHTDRHSLVLDAAQLTEEAFGTILFDFTASQGGYVYASHSAFGRYSAGVASTCLR